MQVSRITFQGNSPVLYGQVQNRGLRAPQKREQPENLTVETYSAVHISPKDNIANVKCTGDVRLDKGAKTGDIASLGAVSLYKGARSGNITTKKGTVTIYQGSVAKDIYNPKGDVYLHSGAKAGRIIGSHVVVEKGAAANDIKAAGIRIHGSPKIGKLAFDDMIELPPGAKISTDIYLTGESSQRTFYFDSTSIKGTTADAFRKGNTSLGKSNIYVDDNIKKITIKTPYKYKADKAFENVRFFDYKTGEPISVEHLIEYEFLAI